MNDLRVLTVKQPLAWAIAHGHKDVENRSWRFPMPLGSTIGIHAGWKRVDQLPVDVDVPDDLPAGVVIALADVVDDHHADDCAVTTSRLTGETRDYCSPWAYGDGRHWRLGNVRRLPEPVAVRGQLWLFTPPPDVTARIIAQRLE